jgi:hypothetical protein
LGSMVSPTVSWANNATISSANGVYNQGTFTFNTNGTWIITYHLASLVTPSPNAIGGIFAFGGLGGSAPFLSTNTGTAPNTYASACGSFVYTISSSVTFSIFINVFTGTIFTNNGPSYVTFTRIA